MSRRVHPEERRHEFLPLFDIPAARAQGHAAAEAASSHASRIEPGWKTSALAAVKAHARTHERFLSEHLRGAIVIPEGADPRALGNVMKDAQRLGYVTPDGCAPAASSNGSYKCVWRSLIFEGERP